ncbi:MAG: hypothetical protein ACLQUY_29420 [Ktedonobacterales bacterium]
MGTIVVLLLLVWLACTALLTIGVGGARDPDSRSREVTRHTSTISGEPDVAPPPVVVGSAPEASSAPAGTD